MKSFWTFLDQVVFVEKHQSLRIKSKFLINSSNKLIKKSVSLSFQKKYQLMDKRNLKLISSYSLKNKKERKKMIKLKKLDNTITLNKNNRRLKFMNTLEPFLIYSASL